MKVINLSDLERSVKLNNQKYYSFVCDFIKSLGSQNLKQGRQRPKDPTEKKILESFKRSN